MSWSLTGFEIFNSTGSITAALSRHKARATHVRRMNPTRIAACVFAVAGAWIRTHAAENAATPVGEPILGPPTLHSLGVHWMIAGDANHNAEIGLSWRTTNDEWRVGAPLRRVEAEASTDAKRGGNVPVPEGAQLFAGSVLLLAPETEYEL